MVASHSVHILRHADRCAARNHSRDYPKGRLSSTQKGQAKQTRILKCTVHIFRSARLDEVRCDTQDGFEIAVQIFAQIGRTTVVCPCVLRYARRGT
jgi:hypothetical protein